jgi:hypothetical protein
LLRTLTTNSYSSFVKGFNCGLKADIILFISEVMNLDSWGVKSPFRPMNSTSIVFIASTAFLNASNEASILLSNSSNRLSTSSNLLSIASNLLSMASNFLPSQYAKDAIEASVGISIERTVSSWTIALSPALTVKA